MSSTVRYAIVAIVAMAVAGVVVAKKSAFVEQQKSLEAPQAAAPAAASGGGASVDASPTPQSGASTAAAEAALPTLLDLGSTTCIPCKQMMPVLDELGKELTGKLKVQFVDIYAEPAVAEKYEISSIPTQVFLDPEGKELFRHIGFFPKADILAKWGELGYDLGTASEDTPEAPKAPEAEGRI
jgi:thiol-disulfide isomerase/thioredoxin